MLGPERVQMVEDSPERIAAMAADETMAKIAQDFRVHSAEYKYTYNFEWLGRPVIQFPQDLIALQELIWSVRPTTIVETGIAHGGTLVFYASLLEMLGGDGRVIGIDVDIRKHNRIAIEQHPMYKRITMIEGSSIEDGVAAQVRKIAQDRGPVFVALDSNHTEAHVLRELELYAPLVTKGSYLVVFDTVIEDMPPGFFTDRPWGKGNSPLSAVQRYLRASDRFEVDEVLDKKLLISAARGGYLRCVRD
jgi:cephalosporin hydroxylase